MQKIMFNDRYGLTDAVKVGRKTMTRRIIKNKKAIDSLNEMEFMQQLCLDERFVKKYSRYQIGEVVAVAQKYRELEDESLREICWMLYRDTGWDNKMFVKADLMPHQIRITDIKVERLKDISDDDILKEGVFQISAPIYRHYNGIGYTFKGWTERGVECSSDTPKGAFKALIDKLGGRGTFESNPFVFVYSFVLVNRR